MADKPLSPEEIFAKKHATFADYDQMDTYARLIERKFALLPEHLREPYREWQKRNKSIFTRWKKARNWSK